MMPILALAASLTAAQAAPAAAPACDTKPLVAAYNNAPIAEIGAAFLRIVDCDARIAAKVAPEKLPKMPYNETATKAAIAAIEVGATDAAIAWVDKLQSDDRASAVRLLGQKCNESAAVQQFFLGRAAAKPNEFWDQRWFRALGECHSQPVQDLLWTEAAKGPGGDRSRYFSVLETYARSAGAGAVPKLTEVLKESKDGELQANVINLYPDAAGVGSPGGLDPKIAQLAAAAIVGAAPDLKVKGVEQARLTLTSLNAEGEANKLAGVRYKEDRQKDGTYIWGAVLVEVAQCKKGPAQRFHVAKVLDNGDLWGDQVEGAVQAAINGTWATDLGESCKGTGTTKLVVPKTPFPGQAAYETWVEGVLKEHKNEAVKKPARIDEPNLSL